MEEAPIVSPDERSTLPKPDGPARSGILTKTTSADRGIVEVPMLTPHLDFHRVENDRVLLVSETTSILLDGRCSIDLLPLLDGTRSRHELVATLAGRHSAIDVQTTLVFLASRGYVVSGEFTMDRTFAAFWCALGASPRWAARCLDAAGVALAGDDGRMARQLARMGVSESAVDPTLQVVVCDDYLDGKHGAINRHHIASGMPWTLVKPVGAEPLFGPVFRPSDGGPCWECLACRLRGNQEVDRFLRRTSADGVAIGPVPTPAALIDLAHGLAALEIAKWLVLDEGAAIHERALSLDGIRLEMAHHRVLRRPQCRACGDDRFFRPDRLSAPVSLQPSPKTVRNSGGVRAVAPEQTLRKYRHLISPVSGVVTGVERVTEESDPWCHVHWAKSNHMGTGPSSVDGLRHNMTRWSSGKGSSPGQSETSAFAEAVERCSGARFGDEILCRRRFSDFAEAPVMDAIHPNDIMLFSDRQYDGANNLDVPQASRFVPSRFDPNAEIEWSPVWSLTQSRRRYLPTTLLYYGVPSVSGPVFCRADSNGCASGNTLEEAILQGFFELVERDAFATWWYNRLSRPAVDLDTFGDDYLRAVRDRYRTVHRNLWVLDVTSDFGIPVFVAVSRRTDTQAEAIIYGAGAHFDPHIALLRAVCELSQFLYRLQGVKAGAAGSGAHEDSAYDRWCMHARLADHSHLRPDRGATPRRRTDYGVHETDDVKEDVERCIALVEDKGMEFLVLDQTRPDIGMPVARVTVPGMRHFWPRFAPGRLYDVPVEMGWLEAPHAEADLNPSAVVV